jgi:hypothetical protein
VLKNQTIFHKMIIIILFTCLLNKGLVYPVETSGDTDNHFTNIANILNKLLCCVA